MTLAVSIVGTLLAVSESLLALLRRSQGHDSTADSGSLRALWVVILASIAVAVAIAPAMPATPEASLAGCAVFAFGAVVRWYSIIHLGRFFTVDVHVSADHEIVDTGPYRILRHPSYTGLLLEILGFGLCLGSLASILSLMLPITAAFLYRIRIEERALERVFGSRYARYRERTFKLIPWLY